jgi:hypothetical protein
MFCGVLGFIAAKWRGKTNKEINQHREAGSVNAALAALVNERLGCLSVVIETT